MSRDTNNPYEPPQSSVLEEIEQETAITRTPKARPLFRTIAGIIGVLMTITAVGQFFAGFGDLFSAFMLAAGVQFIIAGVTGYWYSWSGRRF